MRMYKRSLFWMRRDMRWNDSAAFYRALTQSQEVIPVFILDKNILDKLEDRKDARVDFIQATLVDLQTDLRAMGADIDVRYGRPEEIWPSLIEDWQPEAVFWAKDYESYAKQRDEGVSTFLRDRGIEGKSYKDHVIFHEDEVLKDDGHPYTVFTPYKRKWLAALQSRGGTIEDNYYFKSYPCEKYFDRLKLWQGKDVPSLEEMNFEPTEIDLPVKVVRQSIIKNYDQTRNFPAQNGTSKLGLHFRFGTISIRQKARKAAALNETFLSELIWRDFYAMILDHYPHVEKSAFREKYERVPWRDSEEDFEKWKAGKTGYPIVDAGMRELAATGYMHNRVRMIVASFLTKHLLLDWRWGEAWFAQKLLDYDLASNNGGWQWAAGCGTDAAPYFRIFNPTSQMDKFDKEKKYIRKWVPEYGTSSYPEPMVDHKMARERALTTYKEALN